MPSLSADLFVLLARKPAAPANVAPIPLGATGSYRVDFRGGVLEFYSPYNPGLVDALKNTIPYTHRAFKKNPARWEITADFADALAAVVLKHAGVKLQLPSSTVSGAVAVETRMIDLRYVGRIKERPDGSKSAFGWSGGEWSVIFPADVLRGWFGQQADRPGDFGNLYSVLGITSDADAPAIKSAWRRAARSWHPDVSQEPDAAEQFQRIQHAYEILSDPGKRAKYDAGLALQNSLSRETAQIPTQHEWAAPVRCGLLLAEGTARLGRFVVSKILQWEDIHNSAGQVLVTSWPVGATTFEERWSE